MTRLEFFLAAMGAEMFRNRDWVISAFAVIQEAPEAWRANPFPYRIVQLPSGDFYVNPENPSELLPLGDKLVSPTGSALPPFDNKERIKLSAGQVPNLFEDIETNYGRLFANFTLLVWPFKHKIKYVNQKMQPRALEELILPLMVDEPMGAVTPMGSNVAQMQNPDNMIPPSEFRKFANAMTYISGFADLWVSGGTRKTLLPPPGIEEIRKKLIEQFKDRLGDDADPAAVAQVAKELLKVDAEWLKGDETLNFLIKSKSFEVVRAKKFLMIGGEAGLGDGSTVELVQNSLDEGWDVDKMPAMVNILRAGSFNRGAETMRGGESVKWLLRASSNINILKGDCGSRLGRRVTLQESDRGKYLNFLIVDESAPPVAGNNAQIVGDTPIGAIRLTAEEFPKWVGKRVLMRSPMYCKLPHTDYCMACAGPRLSEHTTGASSAVTDYGSTMMLMFMKANHGKALTLAKYNFMKSIV